MATAFVGAPFSASATLRQSPSRLGARHLVHAKFRDNFEDNIKNIKGWYSKSLVPAGCLLYADIAFAKQRGLVKIYTDDEWREILIADGVLGFLYLFVFPPIIFFYLRARWFKRNTVETFFQFFLVFFFFPGMLLWAPFLNFRPLPYDPTKKHPWD